MATSGFLLSFLACACFLAFCNGLPLDKTGEASVIVMQEARREVSEETGRCEDILCAPVPPSCTLTATREPAQLVASNGAPCPVCPVCIDYIAGGQP